MSQELIKALLVEIDGNPQKLQAALRAAGVDVDKFAKKAGQANAQAAAGADTLATKQANAARGIASAVETVTRVGQASGEVVKQLATHATNLAFAFGPQGAIAGAVGITTIAIIGMFQRTRAELAETTRAATASLNELAGQDANTLAARMNRNVHGDQFKSDLGRILDLDDDKLRAEGLRSLGIDQLRGLAEGRRQMVAAQRTAMDPENKVQQKALQDLQGELGQLTKALEQLEAEQRVLDPLLKSRTARDWAAVQVTRDLTKAKKDETEADREKRRAKEELDRDAETFGRTFESMAVDRLGDAAARATKEIDDAIEEANRLIAEGKDVGANTERIRTLGVMREQAMTATRAISEMESALRSVDGAKAGGASADEIFDELTAAMVRGAEQLATLTAGTKEYERVLAEVLKIEERLRALPAQKGSRDLKSGSEAVSIAVRAAKDDATKGRTFADLAREVQQAADGALQLAHNFGLVDERTTSVLRNVGQIAGNLPALSQAIQKGSAGSIVAASLAIAGSIGSLLGGGPEDAQRREELRDNTLALEALRAEYGLMRLRVSGRELAAGRESIGAFLRRDAREMLKLDGAPWQEWERLAAEFGLTLNRDIGSLRQLESALEDASMKLGEFGKDLDSQLAQADLEIAVRGITDPLEQLAIRLGAYAGRSPAFDRVTAGLDLSTAEGRAAARANIAALFEIMKADGPRLGEGDLSGLNGDQLTAALRELLSSLEAIEQATGATPGSSVGVVSGYVGLTAAAGSRIEDYNRALVGYARESQVTRLAILAQLELLVQRAALPVPTPSVSLLSGTAPGTLSTGVGNVVIQIDVGGIEIIVPTGTDPQRAIANGLVDVVSESLYRGVQRARIAAGDLTVTRVR